MTNYGFILMANVDNKAYNMSDSFSKTPKILNMDAVPWLKPICKCGLSEPISVGSGKTFSAMIDHIPTIQARTSVINIASSQG